MKIFFCITRERRFPTNEDAFHLSHATTFEPMSENLLFSYGGEEKLFHLS